MSVNIKFVQGNEACAEAALYAGLEFFAGYPITPSTEIAEHLSYRLPQIGGKFIQMEDEITSTITHGISAMTAYPNASCIKEKPGPLVAVITLRPVSDAPMIASVVMKAAW